jgi:hypothetical protein
MDLTDITTPRGGDGLASTTTIVTFDDTSINQLIHQNRSSGVFADIWAKIRLVATTYNFVTVWYYLGMAGFPDGPWLFAEILVELIMVFDFLTVTLLRERMPNQWRTMWLLQGKSEKHVWLSMIAQATACFP